MGLEVSSVRVKFVILNAYRTVCTIDSKVDFQRMCHIYMLNSIFIDLFIDIDERMGVVPSCSLFPS